MCFSNIPSIHNSFHSKDNSQSTLGILSYSILSHSRDNQPTLTLSISSVSLPISLLSCATPCILSHQILSHSMDNQTDITLSKSSSSLPSPLSIMCHFRHSIILDSFPQQGLILSISTFSPSPQSPFLSCGPSGVLS